MSRTYRRHLVSEYRIKGIIYDSNTLDDVIELYSKEYGFYYSGWYLGANRQVIKKCRDKKPWYKPNKEFKQMNRRIERAQVNNAIRAGKEALPMFKKSDEWNWY